VILTGYAEGAKKTVQDIDMDGLKKRGAKLIDENFIDKFSNTINAAANNTVETDVHKEPTKSKPFYLQIKFYIFVIALLIFCYSLFSSLSVDPFKREDKKTFFKIETKQPISKEQLETIDNNNKVIFEKYRKKDIKQIQALTENAEIFFNNLATEIISVKEVCTVFGNDMIEVNRVDGFLDEMDEICVKTDLVYKFGKLKMGLIEEKELSAVTNALWDKYFYSSSQISQFFENQINDVSYNIEANRNEMLTDVSDNVAGVIGVKVNEKILSEGIEGYFSSMDTELGKLAASSYGMQIGGLVAGEIGGNFVGKKVGKAIAKTSVGKMANKIVKIIISKIFKSAVGRAIGRMTAKFAAQGAAASTGAAVTASMGGADGGIGALTGMVVAMLIEYGVEEYQRSVMKDELISQFSSIKHELLYGSEDSKGIVYILTNSIENYYTVNQSITNNKIREALL
jgi:hypothetical protein